MGMSENCK
jgi:hypothetical protein